MPVAGQDAGGVRAVQQLDALFNRPGQEQRQQHPQRCQHGQQRAAAKGQAQLVQGQAQQGANQHQGKIQALDPRGADQADLDRFFLVGDEADEVARQQQDSQEKHRKHQRPEGRQAQREGGEEERQQAGRPQRQPRPEAFGRQPQHGAHEAAGLVAGQLGELHQLLCGQQHGHHRSEPEDQEGQGGQNAHARSSSRKISTAFAKRLSWLK